MALSMTATPGQGAAFLISAYGVYEVIAANCSSPQTTEINADTRAATLMKWVHLGIVQAAILTTVAVVVFDNKLAIPIISGAVLSAGFMEASYLHAKAAGLGDGKPGTES